MFNKSISQKKKKKYISAISFKVSSINQAGDTLTNIHTHLKKKKKTKKLWDNISFSFYYKTSGQLLFEHFKYFPPKIFLLDYCYPNFTLRRQGGKQEYNDLRTQMPHKPQLLHRCPHFQCSLTQSNFISNNNKMHSFFNWFLSILQQRYCLISNNIQFTSVLRVYEVHLPFKCNTQVPLN